MTETSFEKNCREDREDLEYLIHGSVLPLLEYRKLFQAFLESRRDDLRDRRKWVIENFLFDAFSVFAVVIIRSLVDSRRDTRSLRKVLERLKDKAENLTQEGFCESYAASESPVPKNFAKRDWSRGVGNGKPHLEQQDIENDIKMLDEKCKPLCKYANDLVTHIIAGMPKRSGAPGDVDNDNSAEITLGQIDEAIEAIKTIAAKYRLAIVHLPLSNVENEIDHAVLLSAFGRIWQDVGQDAVGCGDDG
jgi:hypothetical protein